MRGKSNEQVAKYLAHHSIEIKEGNDHEFSLEAHNRQLGGGPALAAWTYSITKGTCYGALVVGGTAAVIKSGGAALPVVKGMLTAGGTLGGTIGTTSTMAGVMLESTVVAEGVQAGVAVAASNGWLAYIPMGIEAVSAAAAAFAMSLPTP